MRWPRWQLHRGYWSQSLRENSMEAFQAAAAASCEMVEMDVRLSRSGSPFIFHDKDLKRVFGLRDKFSILSDERLFELGIASLEQVLENQNIPRYLNLELKSESFLCRPLVENVARVIRGRSHDKKLLISSFNPFCLFWSSILVPDESRALIVGKETFAFTPRFTTSLKIARPEILNVFHGLMQEPRIRTKIEGSRLPWSVWTVNDYAVAREFLTQGAVSVISDLPPISNL